MALLQEFSNFLATDRHTHTHTGPITLPLRKRGVIIGDVSERENKVCHAHAHAQCVRRPCSTWQKAVKLLIVLCPRPPVPINRAPRKLMSQAVPALLRSTARYQVGLLNYGRRPGTTAFGLVEFVWNNHWNNRGTVQE